MRRFQGLQRPGDTWYITSFFVGSGFGGRIVGAGWGETLIAVLGRSGLIL